MKAILLSIGTRGDIEPFLAIAEVLRSREWEVICVFPEQFRETVEDMGFHFEGFSKAFLDLLDSKDAKMFMGGQGSLLKRIGYLVTISFSALKLTKEVLGLQYDVQERENPDLILYHPKCNMALLWGMAHPKKSMMISPIPGTAHPMKDTTILGDYGKVMNRFSNWLGNVIRVTVLRQVAKRYRKDYPQIRYSYTAIKQAMLVDEKTLYTFSTALFARPDYWPASAKVVGYYERDKTLHWEADESLKEFLKSHQKIVFISFGSMTNTDPKGKTQLMVEVLKKHAISAIINTSWGGLQRIEEVPEHIHFVDNIPYDWIFPQVYAVIHHGGSGTTHTGLKYACPSMIIPHILDQPFWNNRILKLGFGPKGPSIKNLKRENFEEQLLDLMENKTYKNKTLEVSKVINKESNTDMLYESITG